MEKIILSFILLSSLGAGAVGTLMMSGYDMPMNDHGLGFRGGPGCMGFDGDDDCLFHEECEEHMDDECEGLSAEECEELHGECWENDHEHCEHEEEEIVE